MTHRPNHIALTMALCLGLGSWHAAMGVMPAPFPRVAAMAIGGDRNFQDAAIQRQLSRFGIAILSPWLGWEASHRTAVNRVVQSIKSRNPNELIFLHDVINELQKLPQPATISEVAALDSNTW